MAVMQSVTFHVSESAMLKEDASRIDMYLDGKRNGRLVDNLRTVRYRLERQVCGLPLRSGPFSS